MGNKNLKHWYSLSFYGLSKKSGQLANGYTITGYNKKDLVLADIEEAMSSAGMNEKAVLLSVSYLGEWSEEDFVSGSKNNTRVKIDKCVTTLTRAKEVLKLVDSSSVELQRSGVFSRNLPEVAAMIKEIEELLKEVTS